jgi:hypothetical protein
MSEADVRRRLDAVMAAISLPSVARTSIDGDEVAGDAATQRIATAQVDELLRRVAALTGVLSAPEARAWDDVDRVAAQLLLADLAVITSTTRALNSLAGTRLATAIADLVAARREAERSTREAI